MNALGIIADDYTTSSDACPYTALWGEALIRGIEDASGRHERSDRRPTDSAAWIGSADFRTVCDLAGISADMVETAFRSGKFKQSIVTPGRERR